MSPANDLIELREQEYVQRQEVIRLRREIYMDTKPENWPQQMDELQAAEKKLIELEKQRADQQTKDEESGEIINSKKPTGLLGAKTTGLEAKAYLRMEQVPTSFYHLLDADDTPLVSCKVRNAVHNGPTRRLRVISYIDSYSARAVDTAEIEAGENKAFDQLPILYHEHVSDIKELTRATLNVLIEDLDSGKVEIHKTVPVWLLARTSAPLAVQDPKTGNWKDMTRYFGAFVTPNELSIMKFLREVARYHPDGRLVGYQRDEADVILQVKAAFDALKNEVGITYINSLIDFSPDDSMAAQRVRLPRESLEGAGANCIDGTVLFASLLEGMSLNPAIVLVPGHAFLGWETWKSNNKWHYLETTMVGSNTFDKACQTAERIFNRYQTENPSKLRQWSLCELRAKYGITPMG